MQIIVSQGRCIQEVKEGLTKKGQEEGLAFDSISPTNIPIEFATISS
jgi:hypothetical protein